MLPVYQRALAASSQLLRYKKTTELNIEFGATPGLFEGIAKEAKRHQHMDLAQFWVYSREALQVASGAIWKLRSASINVYGNNLNSMNIFLRKTSLIGMRIG